MEDPSLSAEQGRRPCAECGVKFNLSNQKPPNVPSPARPEAVAKPEATSSAWICWTCASAEFEKYRYPPSPWVYCAKCERALTPEEQTVALVRLRLAGTELDGFPHPLAVSSKELMTIKEVAHFLGRSQAAVYKLLERGQLPGATRLAGRRYVRRSELLRSFSEGRVPSPGRIR